MDDLEQVVRSMADRAAVEQVLLRYASAIDIKDYATLRSCSATTSRPATATWPSTAATRCSSGSTA